MRSPGLFGCQSFCPTASRLFVSPEESEGDSNSSVDSEQEQRNPSSASASSSSNTSSNDSRSLLQKIDDFGSSLKPRALKLKERRESESKKQTKVLLTLQVCGLFSLFILYRAYRGFFVLLPAVFSQVYAKLEQSVDSPFTEEPGVQDINPETGRVRWRTRITVALLSGVVTLTYVVGGVLRIVTKFVKTMTSTTSVSSSFEAAAEEVLVNEEKIKKMTTTKREDINGTAGGGDQSAGTTSSAGLAP